MEKLTNLRKAVLLILIIAIIFSLTGCSKKDRNNEDSKKEKINQEMSYLDNKIVTMMNRLNNISFSNYKVISENVKEEKSGSGNESEKNDSNQSDSSTDTGSSASGSSSESGSSASQSSSGGESSGQTQSSEESENNQIFKMTQEVILLNNNEQNEEINWDEIRKDIENIYTIWATISIDLASVGVKSEDIIEFNTILDDIASNAIEKNKDLALTNLAKIYNLIPKYINSYSDNELNKDVITTKAYILNSYSLVNNERWNDANENLTKASEIFSNVMTNQDKYPNRELNINRSYLLLNDLKQSTEKKDKQIFYVRYKNLLQEIDIIV